MSNIALIVLRMSFCILYWLSLYTGLYIIKWLCVVIGNRLVYMVMHINSIIYINAASQP